MKALIISFVILTVAFQITRTFRRKNVGYIVAAYLFMTYFIVAFELVGFPCLRESKASLEVYGSVIRPIVNLVPFADGYSHTDTLNIIFFIPFGFMLPLMWDKFKSFPWTMLYGFLFSAFIEISQLFTMNRATDVTDLIVNTLGACIGWVLYSVIFRKLNLANKDEKWLDWMIFPLIAAVVSYFKYL